MPENVAAMPSSWAATLFRPPHPIVVPLQGGGQVALVCRWPVTQAQWEHFMAVLEAMKPGLVKD
jgi:hypothetical protein